MKSATLQRGVADLLPRGLKSWTAFPYRATSALSFATHSEIGWNLSNEVRQCHRDEGDLRRGESKPEREIQPLYGAVESQDRRRIKRPARQAREVPGAVCMASS